MEISEISLKDLIRFYKRLYRNDSSFKDNKEGVIKIVCGKNRPFYSYSEQKIIAVKDNDIILCACAIIVHKNAPEMLCVAFFEALPGRQSAVDMLMEYSERYGRQKGCDRMTVALDGHVNNGVAFPVGDGTPSFGESYSQQYYHDYFKGFNKAKFISFYDEADRVKARIDEDLPRLKSLKIEIALEHADFNGGFARTMRRYTDLNNTIFAGHKYYFHREYNEDYDLFHDMRPLLKNENLIFARCDDKDVGFILWYPDFNELAAPGKGASALTFLKYKLLRKSPETVKVVEIGVDARYRRHGVILPMFHEAMKSTAKNTSRILSSWILDENTKSKAITQRYAAKHYKDYYAYEKEL